MYKYMDWIPGYASLEADFHRAQGNSANSSVFQHVLFQVSLGMGWCNIQVCRGFYLDSCHKSNEEVREGTSL